MYSVVNRLELTSLQSAVMVGLGEQGAFDWLFMWDSVIENERLALNLLASVLASLSDDDDDLVI